CFFRPAVRASCGNEDTGRLAFQFSLEPERRQLVDLVLELRRYVSETRRSTENDGTRFAEIIRSHQRHVLLHRPSGPHVFPRIDHSLRYEFGHRGDPGLGCRNFFHPFSNKSSNTVDMAVGAVIDDKNLHPLVSFPKAAVRTAGAWWSRRMNAP